MKYGFFIEDITNFEELVGYLKEHINRTFNRLGRKKSSRLLKKKLHFLIHEYLEEEVRTYGWTDDEEFEQEDAARMFLQVFDVYDHELYKKWKEIFRDEIEECFTFEPSEKERLEHELKLHIKKLKGNPIIPFRDIKS
ncbi:hypothetical protein [Bacillus sp. FJAT-45037]|uniref:hypothetical protein n=1 Tax=Bacillus sp. FJAT-45037 TaxID=2011007 RepID=UPI000C24BF9A|nr:hypothetical protein [Bacillus sp. FJAT-45037]